MEQDSMPLYEISRCPTVKTQNMDTTNSVPSAATNIGSSVPIEQNIKPLLGPDNSITVCQFCHAYIKTAVKYTNTTRTHIAAALWGILCCMCCIPYSIDSAKNTDHYCPNCQRYLGTYEK